MKASLFSFLLTASLLATASVAPAQDSASLWWGYGSEQSTLKGVGGGGTASTQTAAVKVPAEVMASYAGSRIKAIRFAVYGNTGQVDDVSYFLSPDVQAVADAERQAVGTLATGWHEFELPEAHPIVAGEDLYVGYTATGVRPIAIVDEPGCEGSCWLSTGRKFYDYGVMEGYNYTLAMQVLIESDSFEATLSFANGSELLAEATGGTLPLRVRSMSPVAVTSYAVALSIDGRPVAEQQAECQLDELGAEHTLRVPLPDLTLGTHTFAAELLSVNGQAPAQPQRTEGTLEAKKYVMYRTHVIEECTGTWCGYCVRGLVAMREMRRNHSDRFIGIAVHGRDEYETNTYSQLLGRISGYPSAFFNRRYEVGTYPSDMESAFVNADLLAECEVQILGVEYTDATRRKVNIYTRSRFDRDHTGIDYRLAFVTLEDHLPDYQSNYYSGGGMGPMGGFENEGSYAYVDLMDVARNITSYQGIANSVPANLTEGQWYDFTYTYTLPTSIKNRQNITLVALLQDANGTEILNAAKCEEILEPGQMAIEPISPDAPLLPTATYDLQGRPAGTDARGLSIQQGRVVLVR